MTTTPKQRATLWALYVDTPAVSGGAITLHSTERKALEAAADYLRLAHGNDIRLAKDIVEGLSTAGLREHLRDLTERAFPGDRLHVEELDVPTFFAAAPELFELLRGLGALDAPALLIAILRRGA